MIIPTQPTLPADYQQSDYFNGVRMSRPPFDDEPMSAVCARVVYRLIARHYRSTTSEVWDNPSRAIYALSLYYDVQGLATLSLWLSVYANDRSLGLTVLQACNAICHRARFYQMQSRKGNPWALQGRNPRVTNRRVASEHQLRIDDHFNRLIGED